MAVISQGSAVFSHCFNLTVRRFDTFLIIKNFIITKII